MVRPVICISQLTKHKHSISKKWCITANNKQLYYNYTNVASAYNNISQKYMKKYAVWSQVCIKLESYE